ncbi:hypothetical protein LROSL1_2060 [Furfurilactobacillus rossiae]|nr:hypothetical protein LROSL1_2060 [Furfurilactobacillus rossiae]
MNVLSNFKVINEKEQLSIVGGELPSMNRWMEKEFLNQNG